jgi:hypothetical protein
MSGHLIVIFFILVARIGCGLEGQTLTSQDERFRAEVIRSNGALRKKPVCFQRQRTSASCDRARLPAAIAPACLHR